MYSGLRIPFQSMGSVQQQMDTISNNLSNAETAGFKSRQATFSEMMYQQEDNMPMPENGTGRLTPPGIRTGGGAAIGQTALRMEQGSLKESERELDFALEDSDAFFQIEAEDGAVEYTKDGQLYLSENPEAPGSYTLVDQNGGFVLNEAGGRFDIPAGASEFSMQENGELTAVTAAGNNVNLGSFGVVQVERPQALTSVGGNRYRFEDLDGLGAAENDMVIEADPSSVKQGMVEQSNVDLSNELVNMMNAQRQYSFNSRALTQGDQMLGLINSIR